MSDALPPSLQAIKVAAELVISQREAEARLCEQAEARLSQESLVDALTELLPAGVLAELGLPHLTGITSRCSAYTYRLDFAEHWPISCRFVRRDDGDWVVPCAFHHAPWQIEALDERFATLGEALFFAEMTAEDIKSEVARKLNRQERNSLPL